jgi:CRISPR system Cascade subunit CasA
MNLIDDPWLLFRRSDGTQIHAAPPAIVSSDVVDLAFPRADFNGAAWQFLIGLLQTAFAPINRKQWLEFMKKPPSQTQLRENLAPYRKAFELLGDGPRFMQDLDPLIEQREISVASLLIEAPGEQGLKSNTDHFVKRGVGEVVCQGCAAMALFTSQTTGPAGGTGYRVGIRGGGPLTTLVLPHESNGPIWQKLLLNVLTRDNSEFSYPDPQPDDSRIFPWLKATRTSEKGSSTPVTTHNDVHPLHVFWAMPNRCRLERDDTAGQCAICGQKSSTMVRRIRLKNYGYNYDGPWRHPLTPYWFNPKKPQDPPISRKGQQGGLGYRHWEAFVLEDTQNQGNLPALVVQDYLKTKSKTLKVERQARLWVFGYDMKQNKPRGWYSTEMPLMSIPEDRIDAFLYLVRQLNEAAAKAAQNTRNAIKSAWFTRPGDAKGDFDFIEQRFWELTTDAFYARLGELSYSVTNRNSETLPPIVAQRWRDDIESAANTVFEEFALSGEPEGMDLKRVITARSRLRAWLYGGKEMKNLHFQAQCEEESV